MLSSWFSFWSSSTKHDKLPDPDPTPTPGPSTSRPAGTSTKDESTPQPSSEPSDISTPSPTAPHRNRSAVLFAAGLTFSALSLLVTRRAFARRRLASTPPSFYKDAPTHTAAQTAKVSGPIEAVEALNLATINVLSLAMTGTGGALWYLGIENMDDAKRIFRGGLGLDESGVNEKEVEEDFEEWIARTLSRKELKDIAKKKEKEV